MTAPADFYTYRQDLRPLGNGTVISYHADSALTDLAEGEMVAYDSTAKTLVRFVRDGSAGNFVGISRDSQNKMASLGNQTPLANFVSDHLGVWSTGIHLMVGKSADSFVHGTVVYMDGTDTTRVTVTQGAGGVAVGTVHLPDGSTVIGDGSAHSVPILIDEYTITQV